MLNSSKMEVISFTVQRTAVLWEMSGKSIVLLFEHFWKPLWKSNRRLWNLLIFQSKLGYVENSAAIWTCSEIRKVIVKIATFLHLGSEKFSSTLELPWLPPNADYVVLIIFGTFMKLVGNRWNSIWRCKDVKSARNSTGTPYFYRRSSEKFSRKENKRPQKVEWRWKKLF